MKRMRLKTWFVTLAALLLTALPAEADITVKWNASTKTLTLGGDGTFSAYTWSNNSNLSGITKTDVEHVVIGGNVPLGNSAFNGATALKTVTFDSSYSGASFDSWCFYGCTALTTITIPSSVKTIEMGLFYGCSSLQSITIPATVTSINTWDLFNECTSLKSVSLKTTAITALGLRCFRMCSSLEGVTIPASVTSIYEAEFYGSNALKYIDLSACTGLTNLAVNRSSGAFDGVPANTIIYMPAGSTATGTNVVVDGKCSDFVLTEGKGYDGPGSSHNFTAEKVTYQRTLEANKVYTICVPYKLPARDGVKYYRPNSYSLSDGTFTYIEITAEKTRANAPFLVVATKAVSDLSITDGSTPISAYRSTAAILIGDGYEFTGTSVKISPAETVGKYIQQSDDKWQRVATEDANVYIQPFRAYILKPNNNGAAELGMALDGSTTAMKQIRTVDADGTERYYDLSGRRIDAPKKGINIVNGKKVVMK